MIIKAGQVAVVTGATQGLGHALAARLLDRGVSVVLAATTQERLQATAKAFNGRAGEVLPVVTDVSDAAAVDELAYRTLKYFGRVDLVINNAGITPRHSNLLWRIDPQEWQRVVQVNLLGVVHGIQSFVPHLMKADRGHVVNIASMAGLVTGPFGGAYCASKHAVVAISETLHSDFEIMGLAIGVTVACPGLVRTPSTEHLFTMAAEDDDRFTKYLPTDLPAEHRDALRESFKRVTTTAMEPQMAAECILTAVEADQLYALTHGGFEHTIRHRAESILAALGDGH